MNKPDIFSPCGNKSWEVGCLVEVHSLVGLQNEPRLFPEGPNDASALHRLIEVGVNGRAAHSFQSAQLTGCGDVEAL